MIALSTSWKSSLAADGRELLAALEKFDIGGIELEYRIGAGMYHQIKGPLKGSGLAVVSVHNYFPVPVEPPGMRGGGDLFSLSHLDREQRRRAVGHTIQSIEHANDLEAPVLILHCGYVQMDPETGALSRFHREGGIESGTAAAFLTRKITERDGLKAAHLDSLLFSLDRLLKVAEKQSIRLGIENRYHYHELPGIDDFGRILNEFKGGPIGYWHDTGHAHAQEALNLAAPGELLERYGDHLIGMYLHDAVGLDDHLAPGSGEIDFDRLMPYVKPDTPLVLELKPGTDDEDVERGLRFIADKQEKGRVVTGGGISDAPSRVKPHVCGESSMG